MLKEEFKEWLINARCLKITTANTRAGNCETIEYYEGDLDDLYEQDQCKNLLGKLEYSKADEQAARAPRHCIHITGCIRSGTATLKSALKKYIEFKQEFTGIVVPGISSVQPRLKSTSKVVVVRAPRVRKKGKKLTEFDYKPTSEQIKITAIP